ncbi:DUF2478 domain-containing protein [uncultured Roseobacter sp.]|uniref:DUF2478 domain-containing protein n=1 Tax=uncultured Roseobacter sp. TaxID=114847 RepID=UPI00261287B2|nr:DUF2478 domain-containing protein [uncultured Roseobacter sp.]
MRIAYTIAPGKGDTDQLLYGFARKALTRGHRLCGAVQVNTETCDGGLCDMDVKLLPDGPVIRISQSLGPSATGCRLDPEALEQAVGLVSTEVAKGADLLIVNKFGKHEAAGRGFRPVIAEALSLDIPVLVGLNALNKAAFMEFTGDLAQALPADEAALTAWFDAQIAERNAPA